MGEQLRIGIDIGGTDTKIGLVGPGWELKSWTSTPTGADRRAEEVIAHIGKAVLDFLDREGLAPAHCMGAGVGMPGTVDREKGVVCYSNNIPWKDVDLAGELGRYLPLPIRIANDADCAALGEALAGAGRNCGDVVLLTLGTGVGGGVILGGEIFSGCGIGGSELGHMVIQDGGEACTCGRRGCLEAYASATALKREARRAAGRELSPQDIFRLAGEGDPAMRAVVEEYIRRLGVGVVNIVNIFRPKLILLGGGLSAQGETLLAPLREFVARESFGSGRGELPALRQAELGNRAGMIGAAGLLA